ncbi:MAG: type II secretion system protein GspG [Bdellovibrionota bacterium]
MKSPFAQETSEAGMTLIEVIAVIVLITLIMVTVGKNVFSSSSAAKAKLNVTKLNTIKGYLGQYRLQYNSYPSKLDELIHPSAAVKQSGELFTPLAQENDLKDIYGTPIIYIPENNGRSYVLKSLGEDGLEGGEGANQDVEIRP